MKMRCKFAYPFLAFFVMNCFLKTELLPEKHLLQFHTARILATNFPTPGWPCCSSCGKYHPGKPCPKEKPPKDKPPKGKKKK